MQLQLFNQAIMRPPPHRFFLSGVQQPRPHFAYSGHAHPPKASSRVFDAQVRSLSLLEHSMVRDPATTMMPLLPATRNRKVFGDYAHRPFHTTLHRFKRLPMVATVSSYK